MPRTPDPTPCLSTTEAARLLRLSPRHVAHLAQQGAFGDPAALRQQATANGHWGTWRLPVEAVQAYAAGQKGPPTWIEAARALQAAGMSVREIAAAVGANRETVRRRLGKKEAPVSAESLDTG